MARDAIFFINDAGSI